MRLRRATTVIAILAAALSSCATGEHSRDDRASSAREPDGERPIVAVTHWTERSELFMEYPVLVAGETGRFAIHVTDLYGFTPLTTGEAVVVLRGRNGAATEFRAGPSRPGIFGADVAPAAPGDFDMSLRVDSPALRDLHELGSVTVHAPGSPLPVETEEGGESISFLKEQQWTLEFGTEVIAERSLQPSLVVPGTVRPRAGGEAVLSAPVSGRIDTAFDVPIPGVNVSANSVLARIVPRSEGIRDAAGLRAALVEAEQQHDLARQERERAARLVESRALPARRLSEAEAAVTASKARLDAAAQRMNRLDVLTQSGEPVRGDDWFVVRAPFGGAVVEVQFAPGVSVEEGDFLARLVDTNRVHVVGSVPESRVSALRSVSKAELILDGQPPFPLGRAVAVGEVVDPATRTVQVRYDLDNRGQRLPVGRNVRLRLFTGEARALPAVPDSAVVDDGGRPVVFVQTGGESFERRAVLLGNREGGYVHVLEGVEPGERVVSRGAYLIRLAAMSTQIPAHGHVH